MSRTRAAGVLIATAAIVAIAARPHRPPETGAAPRAVVEGPALAPAALPRRRCPAAGLGVAARAARWQLEAEAGRHPRIPPATFTPGLARALHAQPPRPDPSPRPARIIATRRLPSVEGVRRALVTVRRGRALEHLTLLLRCGRACRVSGLQ